jgi:hypothetical protein
MIGFFLHHAVCGLQNCGKNVNACPAAIADHNDRLRLADVLFSQSGFSLFRRPIYAQVFIPD